MPLNNDTTDKIIPIDFGNRADCDLWNDFIRSRDHVHCTDQAEWRLFFEELYGIRNYTYAYQEKSRIRGIVSLYHIRSPFMGTMLVTSPFFGYGGFYFDNDDARNALLHKIESVARTLRVDYIEIRLRDTLPAPYQINTDFVEYDLNLHERLDDVWGKQLSSNVRRNIRKSLRHDLSFSITPDYHSCYEVLTRTLRHHGTPFHGRHFFTLLQKYFGNKVSFSEVRHNGTVVAGGIIIRFRDGIITPYIGSLKEYRHQGSNYCQYWGIIGHCMEEKIRRFEFGRSPKGSTHVQFKKKWGTEECQVMYNYLVLNPAREYRSVSRPARIFLLATGLWRRLPLFFTNALGPRLFRYIP